MQRLGVLGGTFDPIHEGHLALARQALKQCVLDKVLLLPMAQPAHRRPAADIADRMAMCRLAIADEPGLLLSEAGGQGAAQYTVETLHVLRRQYPDARFTLILGADKLPTLPYWREADKLFSLCDFLCFPRAGVDAQTALERAREAGARVTMLDGAQVPYSATIIRARTAQYEDAPGLPLRVLCYMAQRGLYQPNFEPQLKTMMNPRRFRHTLGVRREAVRLAALHGAPVQKAALAGLLHDCAKGMPLAAMAQIARENCLTDCKKFLSSGAMLHGPVGAYIARERFGVHDEDVLSAIRSHTVGRPGMSRLELCVFVADATEPGREDYDGLAQIRALAEKSLPAAALYSLYQTRAFLETTNRPFFPIAEETCAYLEGILTPQEKQWLCQAGRP